MKLSKIILAATIFGLSGVQVVADESKTATDKKQQEGKNSKEGNKVKKPKKGKTKKKGKGRKAVRLPDVKLASDSMTVFYGNSFIERLQENGTLEALLHAADPDKKQQFRSMAYTGDQVHFRIRTSRFGIHMAYLVDQWKADRVVMGFGMNESFEGSAGLAKFEKDLNSYLTLILSRHPESSYYLLSPIAIEEGHSRFFPNVAERNADILAYTKVMDAVSKKHGVTFVDLYEATTDLYKKSEGSLTTNGMHLNDVGNATMAKILAPKLTESELLGSIDSATEGFENLRKLVSRKAAEVSMVYHPANGISYYGLRARSYEYLPEIPHLMKVANILDESIWEQSKNLSKTIAFPKIPVLRAGDTMPSPQPKRGLGIMKTAAEDLKDFTLLDGYEVNCFASSEEYPELINPLQIRTDAKGRIWVACFESYPHPLPGAVSNDKILIFEDVDGDGKADKRTVFADNLRLPDGFVFYKDGIIASVSRKLVYLVDTDGDDVADVRTEILRGLDDSDTHHSGYLSRSPQGKVFVSEALFHRGQMETPQGVVHTKDSAIMSFDPENGQLGIERQMFDPNPWKISFDRWGESIQMYGGGQILDGDLYNIWLPTGISATPDLGMPFRYDKGCTCEIVESPHFPKEWQGGLLTGHLLSANEVNFTPLHLVKGAKKSAGKKVTLIKSSNKAFRPSDLTFGIDGSLYISDFYYPIIGHAQHSIRDKNRDYANGRIWRVTKKEAPLLKAPEIIGESAETLVKLLNHDHFTIRALARVELELLDSEKVLSAVATHKSAIDTDDEFALEILWLYERLKNFDDTSLIKRLSVSENKNVQRAATRSLRWWAPVLGDEAKVMATRLSKSKDERVHVGLVSIISHLQRTDSAWSKILDMIPAEANSPVSYMKESANKKNLPSIAAEFPLLKVDPAATIRHWMGEDKTKKGEIYFMSDSAKELIVGHVKNAMVNIDVNDVPLMRSSGNQHSKNSQNAFKAVKGINKLSYFTIPGKGGGISIYVTDKSGNVPAGISYVIAEEKQLALATDFDKRQALQWKEFAENTYRKNCVTCHTIDGNKAVGPALNGLFGRKQTVLNAKGEKSEITIDSAYLREAIIDPMAVYPEGYHPIMPKLKLSEKEVDNLVKWMEQLK